MFSGSAEERAKELTGTLPARIGLAIFNSLFFDNFVS